MSDQDNEAIKRGAHYENAKDGIIDFAAGTLGGIALVYVGQPLDTVKVKMQTFPTQYTSMIDCFMRTLRNDGIARGLYAGTVPALASNVAENSVLFLFYGLCQKFIHNFSDAPTVAELSALQNATAGFLASFFSSLAICPTELVKCKLQAMYEIQNQQAFLGQKVGERVGPFRLISQIMRDEGPTGFFRGLIPTLVREMPGYFLFFGTYEGTRELLTKEGQNKEDIGLLRNMAAGAAAGASFWTLTYPVDVAKSRIQVNNSNVNMFRMISKICTEEGCRTLYNGLTPTVLRTIPSTAALFGVYEYARQYLHKLHDDLV